MPIKSIRDIDVKNKRVLVRTDFNISLNENNQIVDDFRIRASLPTIEYLIEKQAKVILMSHLGKPEGKVNEKLRLSSVQDKLMEHLVSRKSDFRIYIPSEVRLPNGASRHANLIVIPHLMRTLLSFRI